MRRLFLSLITVVLVAFLASCSSDSTDPTDISNLEGTWNLTEFSIINQADPSQVVNGLNQNGTTTSMSMTINSNGSYTITTTTTFNGQSFTNTTSGTFTEDENGIDDSDPNTSVTLNGDTLTIEDTSDTWDFGNGQVPATIRIVFQRQ